MSSIVIRTFTFLPAHREFLEGAALFFDPRDPEVLAGLMVRLYRDEEERKERALASKAKARDFTPSGMAELLKEALLDLQEDHGHAG